MMSNEAVRKIHIPCLQLKMVREKGQGYELSQKQVRNPETAYRIFQQFGMDQEAEEVFVMIALDTKCKPTGIFEVSRGAIDASISHPREIFKRALMANAASIIIAHNHPSGDPTPSRDDIEVTKRIKESGTLLGIALHDHLIIGDDCYKSLKEQELF